MPAGLDLDLVVCRPTLEPQYSLDLPLPAANTFRGGIGFVLPESLFRPSDVQGPSGLRDRPRPFVLRTAHLDGVRIAAGQHFAFSINLFATRSADEFRAAIEEWCRRGVTRDRVPLRLIGWQEEPVHLDLAPRDAAPARIRVEFTTPTELKDAGSLGPPDFDVLMARLRDRIGALRAFYGSGPLALNHAAFRERARAVTTVAAELHDTEAKRTSSRTGQTHPLGGFTGWVEYAGALREFLPFLEAAHYTGVGRQTVWGKGQLSVRELE